METIHHEVALANPEVELARLNPHATFVSVEGYAAWLPDDQIIRIFQQVGGLPDLQTFRISFSFQRFRQLPVLPIPCRALLSLLEAAQNLETLTLDECRLVFHGNDFEALSLALQRAPNLKHVTLFNCFPQDQLDQTERADILAEGLAQINSLQELELIFTLEGPELWIPALLRRSCSSASIKVLRINVPDGSCRGDPLQSMCRALATNSVLKELSIRCPLDEQGGIALGQALKSPHNALEQIYVQLKSYEYAVPIAEALTNNRHVKSFEMRVWTGGDRTPLLKACEAMVPHNVTLEHFILDNGRHGLTQFIDFYLTLNRAGRRALLERGEYLKPQAWIDFMVRAHPDASVLFYTLSLFPCLISTCGNESEDTPAEDAMEIDDEPRHKRQRLEE